MDELKNQSTESTNMLDEKWKENMEAKLDKIMENHLAHLAITVERLTSDVSWLKQYHWTTMTAAIGAFVVAVAGIILNR